MILNTASQFPLAEVEVTSALARRFRERDLTQLEFDQACDELNQDCAAFDNVDLTGQLIQRAVSAARMYTLRAYDAVQLASVITVRTALLLRWGNAVDLTLVSADIALNEAAKNEGLQIDDPNTH